MATGSEDPWALLVIRFGPLKDCGFESRADTSVHTDDEFQTRSYTLLYNWLWLLVYDFRGIDSSNNNGSSNC